MVKALQLPHSPVRTFRHNVLLGNGPPGEQEIRLPESMAQRLLDFCEVKYIRGLFRGGRDFDCKDLLHFLVGWEGSMRSRANTGYTGTLIDPEKITPAQPYAVVATDESFPHTFLGIDEPAHGICVAGYESPLIIAQSNDIVRAFGGCALLQITELAGANGVQMQACL
jgi:hypothetical protein